MAGSDADTDLEGVSGYSRRDALKLTGGIAGASLGSGILSYRSLRSQLDLTPNAAPGGRIRSAAFTEHLEETFGADQVEPLDPDHQHLLLDVRYIGDASVTRKTKQRVEALFRGRGVALQWLDHPAYYDETVFRERYGYRVENILWPLGSFYAREVDPRLKDTALQVVVLPNSSRQPRNSQVYSRFWNRFTSRDPSFLGMSFGNRAVVTEQPDPHDELLLSLHEIGHLGLCHPNDPGNTGVMASFSDIDSPDYTDPE